MIPIFSSAKLQLNSGRAVQIAIIHFFMAKELFNKIRQLFQSAEQSSATVPVIHKMIELTEAEKEDYEFWKTTLVRRRLIDWLNDQYLLNSHDPSRLDNSISFLNTPSSKGFVIHFYKTNYSKREVNFLFHYLKEQVLQLNYRTQISDSRTFNRPNWVETIDRHYLKPRSNYQKDQLIDQKFGNITIEHQLRNDQPHFLKFRATIYKDRLYKEADDFKTLMQAILV
jgi:hypothetical protein